MMVNFWTNLNLSVLYVDVFTIVIKCFIVMGPQFGKKTRETVIVLIHIWRKRPKEKNSKGRKQKHKCGTIQGINRKKFAIIKTLQRLVF